MADQPPDPTAEELAELILAQEKSRDLCQELFKVVCERGQANDLGPLVILSACAELLGTVLAFPMIHTPELTTKTLKHVAEMVEIMTEPGQAETWWDEAVKSSEAH